MASVSFITSANSGATGAVTTYTYTGASLGTADTDRYIITALNWQRQSNSNATVSSVSIGGVGATEAVQTGYNQANDGLSAIFFAKVPTGATGDIVVNFSANVTGGTVGIYRTVATTLSVNDVAAAGNDATNPQTLSVDTLNGWFVIGAHAFNDATSPSVSWSGLTEDHGTAVGGGITLHGSAASNNNSSTETPRAITANRSDSTNQNCSVTVSFTGSDAGGFAAKTTWFM